DPPGFGCVVGRLVLWPVHDAARHGSGVDDFAIACFEHERRLGTAAPENAVQVDVQNPAPLLVGQFFGVLPGADAGVVDSDRERSPRLAYFGNHTAAGSVTSTCIGSAVIPCALQFFGDT